MNWFKKLTGGLSKTSSQLGQGIKKLFTHKKLDEAVLAEFEELLISSDMGPHAASEITAKLKSTKFAKDVNEEEVQRFLQDELTNILAPFEAPLIINQKPQVILFCGVNGNGKTTTIGKLAAKERAAGRKVLLAACDTFRAAAVDQLEVWAERAGVPLIKGEEKSDPASVAYKACEVATKEGYDLVLLDTAGRLQNNNNLMQELVKVSRVTAKMIPDAPHNVLLTLDATTGQNAISQVNTFREMIGVTGLIVTKLDGTAKGGIVVALAKKHALPIHFIGVGEHINDLKPFNAKEFAQALVE
jgi:fused signal recognition particle receptor